MHGSSEINLYDEVSVLLGNTVILGVQQQEVKVTVSLLWWVYALSTQKQTTTTNRKTIYTNTLVVQEGGSTGPSLRRLMP